MSKIKITREQYSKLILTEQKNRQLKINDVLTESIDGNVQLLEEGWKEIVLGISMLMGLNLTGQNNIAGEKAIQNTDILKQIENTLEDKSKTDELVKVMQEKGMKDPSGMLAKNAENIVKRYNEISDDKNMKIKLGVVTVRNLKELESKLKQGYAVKSSEISTDTIKSKNSPKIVVVKDTLNVDMGDMQNLFDTGGYNLTQDGQQAIKDAIESVIAQGGKILSVEIESSTDAESMTSLRSKEDPSGNIKLSNLRTQSVNDIVGGLVSDAEITTREIPNNGSDVVSAETFKKNATNKDELSKLRQQTSEFRYVKLNIIAEFTSESENPEPKPDEIIKKYRFEVVKMYETSSSGKKMGNNKLKFKHKKFKCKIKKDRTGGTDCFTF